MKRFRQYLEEEKGMELDKLFPGHEKPFGTISTSDDAIDSQGLMKVLKMAVENHHDEMMAFLCQLGRTDPHLQDELDALNRHGLNKFFRPKQKKHGGKMPGAGAGDHGNDVMPNLADRGDGLGTEPTD